MPDKVPLAGFNNLTKSLSFNIYDVCCADSAEQMRQYLSYIDEAYGVPRLGTILREVATIIGARVLNVSSADYEPHGASVAMLISEELPPPPGVSNAESPGPDSIVCHLDKSHIAVHTYPENDPSLGICTFRADIDVGTCGTISPLKALNYLIHSFESDIVVMDYRVRGFTRDKAGRKRFIDHDISSIQNFIPAETLRRYRLSDVNIPAENIFHTRMMLAEFNLDDYLFAIDSADLSELQRRRLEWRLRREVQEIYEGKPPSELIGGSPAGSQETVTLPAPPADPPDALGLAGQSRCPARRRAPTPVDTG